MLDNFGFGEFFALTLLALLFFGPEQLPRIGARIGRWIGNMTQYSRAFLDEWREEALVIHDAVEEVKGIRAEINAARAEIASTMYTARTDLSQAVDGAKLDVQGQIRDGTQIRIAPANETSGIGRLSAQAGEAASGEAASGEAAAIDRTQQILDRLPAAGTAAASATLPGTAPAPRASSGTAPAKSADGAKDVRPAGDNLDASGSVGDCFDTPRAGVSLRSIPTAGSGRNDNVVSHDDLARLRGDVSDLSAHVSALQGQLAQIRTAVASAQPADPADTNSVDTSPADVGPADAEVQETGGAS